MNKLHNKKTQQPNWKKKRIKGDIPSQIYEWPATPVNLFNVINIIIREKQIKTTVR